MSNNRNSRRDFLRQLSCAVCAGGASAFIPQLNLIGNALAQSTQGNVTGYRALVCIYLSGGNDAWNMLIPYDQPRFDVYATSRSGVYNATTNPGGLAIDRALLTPTTITDAATGGQYALHPSMTELRTLYTQNRVALLPNIGTLVRPITKTEYNSTPSLRPPQLYSHSDQENQWHWGKTTTSGQGWGGLVADRVRLNNLNQALSPCISIAGSSRFLVGSPTFPYQMSSGGLTSLSGMTGTYGAQRAAALDLMLNDTYAAPFQDEYKKVFKRSRDLFDLLSTGLASPSGTINQAFPGNNSLADQLRMVARMIKLSRDTAVNIQHTRQIYFVRYGGFDLHDGLMGNGNGSHAQLLQRLSQAMNAFNLAMNEIGAQNDVTSFTMSEFARTLKSNGNGSDHAWGGVQLVMGGAVNGGRLYGTFPDQTLNGPVSFSQGQTIPSTGAEQMGATLARWMGVTLTNELNTIFPNLPNFASSNLGFLTP